MRTTLALAAVAVVVSTAVAAGQDGGNLTLNPLMTRGPATAAVTIVEFSDYQ